MGLADTWGTEENDVPVLLDEAQGGELGDELSVEVRLEIEVEISQGLVDRIASKAESTTQPASPGRFMLQLQEPFQDLGGRELLSQSPVQLDAQVLFGSGEPE